MSGYQQQPPPPQYGQPQLGFQQPQPGFQQPQPGFQQGYPPQPYGQPYAAGSSSYGSAQPLPQQQQPYGYDSAAKPAFAAPQTVTGLPAEAAGPHFDFTNAPRWPDLWATLLFLANLTAYIALSVSGFIYGQSSGLFDEPASDGDSTTTPSLSKEAVDYLYGVGATSIGVALIASFIYFLLMQRFGAAMIKITIFLSVGLNVAMAVIMLIAGTYVGGAIFLLFAVLNALFFWFARHRIPLSALTLATVCSITRKYPFLMVITIFSLALQTGFSAWWSFSSAGLFSQYGETSSVYAVAVYVLFCMYFISQVLKNTLHVTVAGTFGSFFFLEGTDAMPKNPTLASAKRAFTTSFGPICFGSLLIAIIQLVRAILRELANQHEILAAIVDCIMGCIQALFEYFSSFAFVYVAIYGQGFIPAAKSTYRLISGAGINVIIADLLIGPVLGIGMLLVGLLSGGIAFLMGYLKFGLSGPELNAIILVTIIGFIVGIVLMSIVTSVIDSGVQTILVCVAEDPASLQRTKPELYNKFRAVYPQIQWS